MKKSLFLFIGFLFIQFAYSQERPARKGNGEGAPKAIGQLSNEANEAIPFANIAVYKSSDSSLVKGTSSDENGKFSIPLRPGNYFFLFSFLSYEKKYTSAIVLGRNGADLGNITLKPSAVALDAVEVQAERSQVELKLDKRVFNVGKDLSNAGANAAEILDNVPSVSVDIEGNISLRGSENVRVLINGKPSAITGGSTADVLRQFQGSMIDRVEVITNPSARYDAEGEAGIINIVLKKEKRKGVNGSIEAVAGYPDNYRLSYNLNFRREKFNFFTSFGIGYRDSPGLGENYQVFQNADTAYQYESESERSRANVNQNIRLGADFYLNEKNSITLSGLYRYSDEKNTALLTYRDLFSNGELFQYVERKDIEDEYDNTFQTSLQYVKKFKKKDQKFTIDLQWGESNDLEKSNIQEQNFQFDRNLIQKTRNVEANRNYLVQSDFILPYKKDGKFETGIRLSIREMGNDYKVEQLNQAGEFQILPQFFNDFKYSENIYASYVMFGNKVKKFSYQLGLRAELSDIATELKRTGEKNSWNYDNLFPSAHFSYEFKNKDNVQLSYSRRINRPNFRYLLPFQTFSDQRNLWSGNPELQPEFTNSYELGYLKYMEKGSLFSSIYYRHRTGVISRITTTDALGFTRRLPANLSVQHNLGFEFNGQYKFNKNTNLNASFNFFRSMTEGSYQGINLNANIYSWTSRMTFKTAILPKVDFQSSIMYRAPQKTGQGERKSLYSIDLALAKDVLKGKGTLVASVRDLLNSRKRRGITQTEELYSESEFQWRARQFLLSFTYRINQKKRRTGGNRSGFDGGEEF